MNPWQDWIDWFVNEVGGSEEEAKKAIGWAGDILQPTIDEARQLARVFISLLREMVDLGPGCTHAYLDDLEAVYPWLYASGRRQTGDSDR